MSPVATGLCIAQGRNEKGQNPGRRKFPVSQVLVTCFRKTVGSSMGTPNLLLASGAI